MRTFLIISIAFFVLSSCYREYAIPEPDADVIDLWVDPETELFLNRSRDTSYTVESEELNLYFNDQAIWIDEIRVRGQSALNFRRKSFAVFLDQPIIVSGRNGTGSKSLTRFKLLSMAQDYTYIENRIGLGILEKAGLMPLFFKFVEFRINGNTQGVYMLIEDPEMYARENGSEYILRRGYNHGISDFEYFPMLYQLPPERYRERYLEIYSSLSVIHGEELYTQLSNKLDMESYFRKMIIDYLLRNGDYTDELYFTSSIQNDSIIFKIIPWDYDDLFDENPHEIGISWGMGKIYGNRHYESQDEIIEDIGDKLIFSVEDDLDYTVAIDSFLYSKYIEEIGRVVEIITEEELDHIIDETGSELETFYSSPTVIGQSNYDDKPTSLNDWQDNMVLKRAFLKERLQYIKNNLNE